MSHYKELDDFAHFERNLNKELDHMESEGLLRVVNDQAQGLERYADDNAGVLAGARELLSRAREEDGKYVPVERPAQVDRTNISELQEFTRRLQTERFTLDALRRIREGVEERGLLDLIRSREDREDVKEVRPAIEGFTAALAEAERRAGVAPGGGETGAGEAGPATGQEEQRRQRLLERYNKDLDRISHGSSTTKLTRLLGMRDDLEAANLATVGRADERGAAFLEPVYNDWREFIDKWNRAYTEARGGR